VITAAYTTKPGLCEHFTSHLCFGLYGGILGPNADSTTVTSLS
jgi:hypothetical protein